MSMKKYFLLLVAVFGAFFGFAKATDNKTFENIYNLSPREFRAQFNYYSQNNDTDSAMLCANIQASKYGKKELSNQEIEACCVSFHYMGIIYLQQYYNYQLATENLLKAEQIAKKHNLTHLQVVILTDKSILTATRNDLETNFTYCKDVFDIFSKAFYFTLHQIKSAEDSQESNTEYLEISLSNLLYLAIKYGKTADVAKKIRDYHEVIKSQTDYSNMIMMLCRAVELYNINNFESALQTLRTPISRNNDRDFVQFQSVVKLAQYAVLVKSGKRAEALKLLLQHEQFLRDNGLAFEQLEAQQLIWQHYEVDGNRAMADKFALQYYIAKDEFINKSKVGKMDQAKLNLELEQSRERISEMSYRQKIQTILLWSSIIITLLALTLLAVLYTNYRKTKRTNRLLYEKNIALLNEGKELRIAVTPAPVADHAEVLGREGPTQADCDLMDKIIAVLESSPEIYSEDFSRQRLAELVDSNVKYVSRAINACKKCNFYMLLNEYRIKEACRRLMDSATYGNLTIEGIANSVGYKSRSNFAAVFKDIVGLTPSAFQKMHREQSATHPED